MNSTRLHFISDLDRYGRYARESIIATDDEVRVFANGESPHLSIRRSLVSEFQVESYISSGAMFAIVSGVPTQISRFTNACLSQAVSFVRILNGEADSEYTGLLQDPKMERKDSEAQHFTGWSVLKRILHFAPESPLKLALVLAALLVHTAANVAAPYVAGTLFFDRVLQPGNILFGRVGLLVAMIVGVRLVEVVFRIMWAWTWAWYHHQTILDLRVAVFACINRLSLGFFANNLTGSLLSRMNRDMNGVGLLLGQTAPHAFVQGVMVVGSFSVMVFLDLRLAALSIAALPLYVWAVHRAEPAMGPGASRTYRAESEILAAADDSFVGARVVRAFGGEEQEMARFRRTNDWAEREEYHRVALAGTVFPLGQLLLNLGVLLVWAAGAWWLIGGSVSFGVLISFVGYLTLMGEQLVNVGAIIQNWVLGTNSMQRMARVLVAKPTVADPREAPSRKLTGPLKLNNVTFAYEANRPVLHAVNLHASAGEMVGLVGHTGAGKTTIANLITRLYDVDQGEVLIGGVDVRTIARGDLRRQIGIVLQDPYIFSGSVADNIRYGMPEADDAEVIAAAEAAYAHDFIMLLPDGYDTIVGQGGYGLSGGEQQRISIARALLLDPPLLVLDEATSSVDTETELHIQHALSRLVAGRTTVTIAHRLSTLRQADRLYVLVHGRVMESGSHDELMEAQGVYCELVRTQLQSVRAIAVGE